MSETIASDPPSAASEKPVIVRDNEIVKFPPFPDPTDDAFEEDISEEERNYYKSKFPDLNAIKNEKLHCSACDRHLGCAARNESRMRMHPMLRTLVCHTCHTFYNSGEFDKGEDGSELYCRWCGQGGQVYCCSDCPVVFCAKCIKRNFGMPKIKEIENTDDWKCFKCNSKCLWDLRAVCWALLRYCDLKNKLTYQTEDSELKESYQKACAVDDSECCKSKITKKKEKEARKKEYAAVKPDNQRAAASKAATAITNINVMTKIPPTIQVKKFASINLDESPPKEKKAPKRSAEKEQKSFMLKTPITVSNRLINPIAVPPVAKKIRMPTMPVQMTQIRFPQKNYQNTYTRIRPKPPAMTHMPTMTVLNNFINNTNMHNMMNNYTNDNINLSLESLTQGLDMAAVSGMVENDVVCTPDFPLEPLCEVTEDNNDDDVECITPGPVAPPISNSNPPPLVPRGINDITSDNIIQMTENDVTVNAATGGLKFRVDPQTLSSNKMYRLPDGRVFAINSNPNMPGGYSATIVALTENNSAKLLPKGSTYAAKLSAISTPQTPSPTQSRQNHTPNRVFTSKRSSQRRSNTTRTSESPSSRVCDLKIPVEWYRYNLIDAVDALEYSLSRLHKIKKEASTMFLRTRTLEEMQSLHKTLDSLLKTSSCRFNEIRDNLNKEMKRFSKKKTISNDNITDDDDDDDDVEILNDVNDDPIFIDENSMESNNINESNTNLTNEVDLTGPASSEHNDSAEKSASDVDKDPLNCSEHGNKISSQKHNIEDTNENNDIHERDDSALKENKEIQTKLNEDPEDEIDGNGGVESDSDDKQKDNEVVSKKDNANNNDYHEKQTDEESRKNDSVSNGEDEEKDQDLNTCENKTQEIRNSSDNRSEDKGEEKIQDVEMCEDKNQDTEMSEELIDSLLKEDNVEDDSESANLNCLEIPGDFSQP